MSDCGNVQKAFVSSKLDESEKKQLKEKKILGIDILDVAAEKIKHFATIDKKDPNAYGLRISVVKDGCSGNSYTMELAEIAPCKEKGDKIFEKDGATVIIDKLSYMFVLGSQLDYSESLLASGFQLVNPNVKKSCSCGSSFSVQ